MKVEYRPVTVYNKLRSTYFFHFFLFLVISLSEFIDCTRASSWVIFLKDKEKGCIDLSKAGELGVEDAYSVIKKYCIEEEQ